MVLRGEVLGVGPIVAVGVSTFDGKGHFVTDQTVNLNGNVVQAPGTGTYTVNRNCTGIADVVGTGPHSFVIIDDGKQMDLMDNNSRRGAHDSLHDDRVRRTITTKTECRGHVRRNEHTTRGAKAKASSSSISLMA